MKQEVGKLILELANERGKSLRQLARESGVSNAYLSQLTRGLFAPTPEILIKLAPHLGVEPRILFERAGWLETEFVGREVPQNSRVFHEVSQGRPDIVCEVGDFILQLLRERGESLRWLGREAGVSNSYLSQLTRGRFVPTPEILIRLAPHLGVEPADLFAKAGWLETRAAEGEPPDEPVSRPAPGEGPLDVVEASGPAPVLTDQRMKRAHQGDLVTQVLDEIHKEGLAKFPDNFLPEDSRTCPLRRLQVPPVKLQLASYSRTKVVAPGLPFEYEAANPVEAAYIIYAHIPGENEISLPADNLALFKTVKSYERYVRQLRARILERFAELTLDGTQAERLSRIALARLGLPEVQC